MRKRKTIKYTRSRYDKECMKIAKSIVRIRDRWICQKCWSRKMTQCSHVINDGADTRLSVDPINMKLLCYSCHLYRRHRNPIQAYEWYTQKYPKRLKYLKEQHKANMSKGSISLIRWEETYNELKTMYWKMI